MLIFQQNFTPTQDSKARDCVFEQIFQEREEKVSGYYDLPFEQHALRDSKVYIQANQAVLEKLTDLVIIGIGGSSLGTKAIDCLLSSCKNRKNITLHFLEHTDSIHTQATLESLKLPSTLFVAISKSGTTIETLSLCKYILKHFGILESPTNKRHFLTITDSLSPLESWSKKHSIHTIAIPSNVGGRFSVLSSVGIVPLAILGYDTAKLLLGAAKFMESFFARKEEHLLDKALFYAQHKERYPINVLFSYSSIFKDFNSWYMQLWAESLGKITHSGESVGLTPIGLIGSIDQHSFLQLIVQGHHDKSVSFLLLDSQSHPQLRIPDIDFLESGDFVNNMSFAKLLNTQQLATIKILDEHKIPTDSITLTELSERSIGALITYYELLTSCVGRLLNINPYDQPGVEFGKKLLKEMLLH